MERDQRLPKHDAPVDGKGAADPTARTRILVDLSSAVVADGVSRLLQGHGYRCDTGEPSSGDPDVILVDSASIHKGVEGRHPNSRVLLLETDGRDTNVARAILFQKVHGIVSHTSDVRKLVKAIDAVAEGQVWIDNTTIESLLQDAGLISARGQIHSFTPQEKIIVESICRGETNKAIAQRLHLSINTVKTHLRNIMRKAGTVNRSHLASIVAQTCGDEKGEAG
jgi:DNA-binding NarL/FixJ family response regulator